MPRYFFHMHNRVGWVCDDEGEELAGVQAARERAFDSIRSVVSDETRHGVIDLRGKLQIVDEAGEEVMVVPFLHAFELDVEGDAP